MNYEDKLIEKFRDKFNGGGVGQKEADALRQKFGQLSYFDSWLKLVQSIPLIGLDFELSEEMDLSGFGVDMEIMDVQNQIEEAFEVYPGIAAIKKGYIPFAMCLRGAGDPYFVNVESDQFKVYRIPHAAVLENDSLDESQVELVSGFAALLNANM